ncbi:TlpA family protein disulfide reductase [Catenulispora acidiphila]|uniref:TlpA family protein disulfide reductase n=1 Tax=Catenulispora acidiphila TaxID=304895 RepID=UPI00019DED6B|nr:TlpA disulfide reductase family protein [Catenulispora acidiphila]
MAVAISTATVLAVGLAACGGAGPKNAAGLGTAGAIAADHRKPFPVLSGTTLDGAQLDLSSYKGQIVVMNIWASWCDSCEAEAPYLEHAYETYKDKGVRFVGIDAGDDNTGQARAFVKAKQIGYPNLVDGVDEKLLTKLAGITSLGSVPSTLIIDKNGDLAWRSLRPVDYNALSAALGPVIAEQ